MRHRPAWRPISFGILAVVCALMQAPLQAYGLTDLVLLDASFATRVIDRSPERAGKVVHLSNVGSDLWFWVHLSCTQRCEQTLVAEGKVTIFMDWYRQEGGVLIKQLSTPLVVRGARWRTWGSKRVRPGHWVTVIRTEDSEWVCLKEQCHFSIEIKP